MKSLVAEALDLEPNSLDRFFHDPPRNKVSVLKYPVPPSPSNNGIHGLQTETHGERFQGVGSHKDGGFLTYLLQATPHAGLEAQNKSGEWVAVPPIEDTLVINVGRSLESMTGGACTATTHRVSLRHQDFVDQQGRPLGPRYSFPVFQTLKLDLMHEELCSLQLPAHIRALVQDQKVKSDAEAFFAKHHLMSPGQGIFTARLTSHPDVGRRWYPELLEAALKGQKEAQV
jgi:isopenicillin N synthase-like dioxygenase